MGDVFVREVDCSRTAAGALTDELSEWAAARGVPQAVLATVALIFDELYTNVGMHGYGPGGGPVMLRACIDAQAGDLRVTLQDRAPPFDPTAAPQADTSLGIDERQVGGLGLLFVRKKADVLSYRRLPGAQPGNEVTFHKRYRPAAPAASSASVGR